MLKLRRSTYFLAASLSQVGPVTATTRVDFFSGFLTEMTNGFYFAFAYLAYNTRLLAVLVTYFVACHNEQTQLDKRKWVQE